MGDEFLWMIKKLEQSGALDGSSGGGGFGSMLGGALGKATAFGGLFGKKKFDTEGFHKKQQERQRDLSNIEHNVLSKETKKKLEKQRRGELLCLSNVLCSVLYFQCRDS